MTSPSDPPSWPPPPPPPPGAGGAGGVGPEERRGYYGPGSSAAPPTCYLHPDRVAGSVCRRCNRPICPDCMRQAPVGWQCAKCVHRDSRQAPVTRWRPRAGGRLGNTRMTPVVLALIAVNVAVYIWEQASGSVVLGGFRVVGWNKAQYNYGMWPYRVHHGQWYRLLTAPWLHANFEHILFNMITLAIVGPPVEAELGRSRFLGVYLVAAFGGSVGSYLLSSANVIGVGASGAIFGIMGAYVVLARRRRWDLTTIVALIVLNLIVGFASTTIDWRAHLGGLASGALVTAGLVSATELRRRASRAVELAAGSGAVLGVVAVLAALTLLPPGHVNL